MNLCDKDHDEVCYESKQCPVCVLIADKDKEIADLSSETKRLEEEVKDLSARLTAYETEEPVVTEIRKARKTNQ